MCGYDIGVRFAVFRCDIKTRALDTFSKLKGEGGWGVRKWGEMWERI
jgi:hypothetical protein